MLLSFHRLIHTPASPEIVPATALVSTTETATFKEKCYAC